MPRSPKRSKPYTSLQKQNRHYRQKRAQFVKGLCASAHMNGSEFLIMLASPKGQVETFASEAFRPSVTHWLPESLLREARNVAVAAQEKRLHERTGIDHSDRSDEDDDGEESDKEFLPAVNQQHEMSGDQVGTEFHSVSLSPSSFHPPVPSLSFDSDNTQRTCGVSAPQALNDISLTPISATSTLFSPSVSSFLGPFGTSGALGSGDMPLQAPHSENDHPSYTYGCHGLKDIAYIPVPDKFYETKFAALQQKATKRIAKAWIKVIEPKKQTRFPYNKGEAAKPSWWPRNLRHKEPDHLKSQERTELLIAILRSPLIRVEKLELKTAEEASFLQQDKIPLLREIYRVAREEEKARDPCLAIHHRGMTSFHASSTLLKRHNPVESDTEVFPPRPSNPSHSKQITVPGVANINQATETMHLKGTTRSFSLEDPSPNAEADHPRLGTHDAVMRKSPRTVHHETVPASGGPFTFQPLSTYCSFHDPKRSTVGAPSQLSQVIPRSASLSTSYTTQPHAHTMRVIHQAGASAHGNGYSLPFIINQPQKYPYTGATTPLYGPVSESTSGSTADVFEDVFQSSTHSLENGVLARPGFPSTSSLQTSMDRDPSDALSPTHPLEDEAWQGNGNGDTSSVAGACSLHSFRSETRMPLSVHFQEGPDVPDNTTLSTSCDGTAEEKLA